VVTAVLLVAACRAMPPPESTASDDLFRVTLRASRAAYALNEPIDVRALIEYLGPEASIRVGHGGAGPVVFALEQLDGPFDPGGAGDDMCTSSTLHRPAGRVVSYVKSGGWDGDDPQEAAYRQFFDDPLVRLGPGTYRFTAYVDVSEGECGGPRHELNAAVTVVVAGGSGRPLEPPPASANGGLPVR
jgi:hypothetical protein